MRITPLDIQHKTFPKKFKGFDPEQVTVFLEAVAQTVESLVRENTMLREKLATQEHELAELRKAEATLTSTLITTQNFADQMKITAQQDADRIIKEAELHAEQLVVNARTELADLHRCIADIRRQRMVAVEQIRSTINTVERLLDMNADETAPALQETISSVTSEETPCSSN